MKHNKRSGKLYSPRAAWRTLVNVSMAYAQMAQEDPEEDEDEDEPILQEIKGPDLAVSTRFG